MPTWNLPDEPAAPASLSVSALYSYPIKGCAGNALPFAALQWAGLPHDRTLMVVDAQGGVRTQRSYPRLAQIHPRISADGTWLSLGGPNGGSLDIAVDTTGQRRPVSLFGVPYQGIDQGDEVAEYLSDTLGEHSRLVRVPPEHDRITDGQIPGTSGYADSCPVHIVSEQALHLLNSRLTVNQRAAVPMQRFRPNIVIRGGEPHVEDRLRQLRIGKAELGYAKLAVRCVVTTVDQTVGSKTGPEPLRTLADYRRPPVGGVTFGTKFAVTQPGEIAVGDEVTVDRWGRSEMHG